MKRRQQPSRRLVHHAAYREAFQRLDEALAENTPSDNSETIRLMRQAAFADVDEFMKSGELKLPKWNHR